MLENKTKVEKKINQPEETVITKEDLIEKNTKIKNNPPSLSQLLDFSTIDTFEKDFPPYGVFKVKMPTPRIKMAIASRVASFLGENGDKLSQMDKDYAKAIITCDNVIIQPKEFIASDCKDEELVADVWSWYLDCLREFEDQVKKKKDSYTTA